MGGIKDAYQDIQPVTLQLAEDSITSHLYCSSAKGIETHLSTLVEAFLVEVYRCRVCLFTSSQKAKISRHVSERHSSQPCPHLPCLEKEEEESLTVGMRVDEENELEQSDSPYDLHSDSKNSEDQMDMERMSFLLPMYGMLQNINSPCDIGLSSNSDGNLHVAQTCEVSTLFEEDQHGGNSEEEGAVFQLEDTRDGLSEPLSSSMACTEDQDEEMAQSAHLMTLGLCRISSTKCPSQPVPLVSRIARTTGGQNASKALVEDKQHLLTAAEMQKHAEEDRGLSCILCQANMATQSLLEVHLKCHHGEQGFKCPSCGWVTAEWVNMERHWKGHERRRSSRPHKCAICPRTFKRVDSRDAHQKRHDRRHRTRAKSSPVAQCPLCLEWCHSEREWEMHKGCHFQGGFKCVHCDFTEKSWKKIHKHILNQHTQADADTDQQVPYNEGPLKLDTPSASSYPKCLRGVQQESWFQRRNGKAKDKVEGRKNEVEKKAGVRHTEMRSEGVKVPKRNEFCCTLCDRKFSSKLTMRRHMGIHQGDKPFECPQCHYSTRLKASLIQHLRVHTGEKPYKCPQCSYASIDGSSLKRHLRTHTQEKPYHCQYCPYSCIQKKSLDLHSRRHHTGESFPCPLCQYSTPDRQLLLRHTHKHHSTEQSSALRPRSQKHSVTHNKPSKRQRNST